MKISIANNFREFFRLNLISLKLNSQYKLNVYLLLLLFICIISSIIIRSNLINVDLVNINNDLIILGLRFLLILSILYSIKLIFDNINRISQAFLIIPEFIFWYKQDVKNIKSIITLYYIQNIFFILLSSFILYNILNKLSLFINNVDIFILTSGIISSIIFFYNYPLRKFTLNTNIKTFSIWVYLLLLFFFIFYIFIFPFIIFNIIESDKFISFKNDFINKCLENITNNMDNSDLRIENNRQQNTIDLPNRNRLAVIGNENNNSISVRDARNSIQFNNYNIDNLNVGTQTVNNNYPQVANNNNLITNTPDNNTLNNSVREINQSQVNNFNFISNYW